MDFQFITNPQQFNTQLRQVEDQRASELRMLEVFREKERIDVEKKKEEIEMADAATKLQATCRGRRATAKTNSFRQLRERSAITITYSIISYIAR